MLCAVLWLAACQSNGGQTPPASTETEATQLRICGSDTELELVQSLANAYHDSLGGFEVDIVGGGSVKGITSLVAGEANMANASRRMLKSERKQAANNGLELIEVILAQDAVAIITHSKIGVDSLSLQELADIFEGRINNWKELGGPNLPITLVGRNADSGTHHYVKSRLDLSTYPENMTLLADHSSVFEAVRAQKGSIGYVDLGHMMDENGKPTGAVWAMPVYVEGDRAYSPLESQWVATGDYPLTRPLYQYLTQRAAGSLRAFARYELSTAGQDAVARAGFIRLNNVQAEINASCGLY